MNKFQEIDKLVLSSSLDRKEQEEFTAILGLVSDEELSVILSLFQENKETISWMYNNFKSKKAAFSAEDDGAWQKILEEEHKQLSKWND